MFSQKWCVYEQPGTMVMVPPYVALCPLWGQLVVL